MNIYSIYIAKCNINNKIYIGWTGEDLDTRIQWHIYASNHKKNNKKKI